MDSVDWNGGMEWWNGMVEWNGGMDWTGLEWNGTARGMGMIVGIFDL